MLVTLSVAVPVLERVTLFDWLVLPTLSVAKARLVAERLTAELVDPAPVPVKVTICGLPPALSVIVIAPLLVPVVVGVNVTLIVQAAFAVSELGHVVAA